LTNKNLVKAFGGLAVVTILGLGVATVYSLNIEDSSEYSENSNVNVEYIYTTDSVKVDKALLHQYDSLDFSSVDSFLTSLNSTVKDEEIDILYENRLYDSEVDDIISLYESGDGTLEVAVDKSNQSIMYCKFKGVNEERESEILGALPKDSEYKYKAISDGFILEPSSNI
jgi:hypothetical protein